MLDCEPSNIVRSDVGRGYIVSQTSSKKPFIQVAYGQAADRTPIWFMRQAGRYLPEYRAIRAELDFVTLVKTPKQAAEVTIQPLRRFDLDAAIIFSDILIPCTAMGQTLTFDKGHGPVLTEPVRSAKDVAALKTTGGDRDLGYVGEAIALTKAQLNPKQTMIGFAGAPFTVGCYMIEGGGSKQFTHVRRMMYEEPAAYRDLLTKIVEISADYLRMQVESGAEALMLFDTWAGELSSQDYRTFILPALSAMIAAIKPLNVPIILFPGQGAARLFDVTALKADVLSIDWRLPMTAADAVLRSQGESRFAFQGNLDPGCLIAPKAELIQRTQDVMRAAGATKRSHIFNVGHGLMPHTPPESLTTVIEAVRSFKA